MCLLYFYVFFPFVTVLWNGNSGFDGGIKDSLSCDGAITLHVLHWVLVCRIRASSPDQNNRCLTFSSMPLMPWYAEWSDSSTSPRSYLGMSILLPIIDTPSRKYNASFISQHRRIISGCSYRDLWNPFRMCSTRNRHSSSVAPRPRACLTWLPLTLGLVCRWN